MRIPHRLVSCSSRTLVFTQTPTTHLIKVNRSYAKEITPKQQNIDNLLNEKLKPTKLQIVDISGGCGQSFQVNIASEAFEGVSAIKRHRMVHEAIKQEMEGIHALNIVAVTPTEFEQKNKK